MKFELINLKQKFSDEELINDLRTVANNLEKNSLKLRDYCKDNGAKYTSKTAVKRFGNWDNTLKNAGLKGEKSLKGMEYGEKCIKDEVLLADLIRVATELNNPNITINDYKKYGIYTQVTMGARFGSWNKAKERANLEVTYIANNSNEDLFQNILELWTQLGRQPKYGEVISPNSKFHGSTYAKRFGSWRASLEAFIEYVNSDNSNQEVEVTNSQIISINVPSKNSIVTQKEIKIKRTPRGINLRFRWAILKRDSFSCRKCGRSPAKDPSIILHVDHIIPWSKDGETVIENLETLCEQCNLGKSNLI
jgi:5-methylcytosine-specific restriction endonuclease McrA